MDNFLFSNDYILNIMPYRVGKGKKGSLVAQGWSKGIISQDLKFDLSFCKNPLPFPQFSKFMKTKSLSVLN